MRCQFFWCLSIIVLLDFVSPHSASLHAVQCNDVMPVGYYRITYSYTVKKTQNLIYEKMGIAFGKISVEVPAHVVVHKTEHYEIWRYPATIAATVNANDLQLPAEATERDFTSAAFRTLARYIGVFGSPQNRAGGDNSEKMAMTAPVEMNTGESIAMTAPVEIKSSESVAMTAPVEIKNATKEDMSKMQMSFFLPSKYGSISEAPVPTNEAVKLGTVPSRYAAVVQYSGNLYLSSSAQKAETLLEQLRADGFEIVGEWSYCGYNPPFTLPWLKRNEVHVPVEGSRFDSVSESITNN